MIDVIDDEPETECGWTCEVCLNPQLAGSPVHAATWRDPRQGGWEGDEEVDTHEREVRWCDDCDSDGAGLRRGMGRTTTTVHRCDCGPCVERPEEQAA